MEIFGSVASVIEIKLVKTYFNKEIEKNSRLDKNFCEFWMAGFRLNLSTILMFN